MGWWLQNLPSNSPAIVTKMVATHHFLCTFGLWLAKRTRWWRSLLRYVSLPFVFRPQIFLPSSLFSLMCTLLASCSCFVYDLKNSCYLFSSLIQQLHDEQFLITHALYRSQNMRTNGPRGAVGLRFYTQLDGWGRGRFCSLPVPLHPTSITTFISTPEV